MLCSYQLCENLFSKKKLWRGLRIKKKRKRKTLMRTVLDFYALKTLTRTYSFRCLLFTHHSQLWNSTQNKSMEPTTTLLGSCSLPTGTRGWDFWVWIKKVLENNGKERGFREKNKLINTNTTKPRICNVEILKPYLVSVFEYIF